MTLVPPLKLARADARQGNHFFGCEALLHRNLPKQIPQEMFETS
jgi:hypothetical protein